MDKLINGSIFANYCSYTLCVFWITWDIAEVVKLHSRQKIDNPGMKPVIREKRVNRFRTSSMQLKFIGQKKHNYGDLTRRTDQETRSVRISPPRSVVQS